ncbi:MAG: DUF1351 domain-containing protein [Prevotellaceae bacterium]|jgi:hypothetical protein|nr:DUF1351 domain-containing protein [Prevotellaceae bacterium]
MEQEEIKLVQSPVIRHRLTELGYKVTQRIAELNIENQVATVDSVTALKSLRAELNKEAKIFEAQRKAVKEAILTPYDHFESIYKAEIIDKYKNADELLKSKINAFEMKIKSEKRQRLIDYFNEIVEHESITWLSFDRLNIEVGLSISEKKYKEEILAAVGKIIEDLDLIRTETYYAEILVEYKKTLNVSQSITVVRQRRELERIEQERIKQQRAETRIDALKKLSFLYSDIANAYYFMHDNTISISRNDIENLENQAWMERYVEFERTAKKQQDEKKEQLKKPVVEDLQKHVAEEPVIHDLPPQTETQELYQAQFLVTATLRELNALKEFLISNNYQYKNI